MIRSSAVAPATTTTRPHQKSSQRKKWWQNRKFWFLVSMIFLASITVYLVAHGRSYFNRRLLRQEQRYLASFGPFSPLIVFLLILLSTLIPPLPLPVTLIETATGALFGFFPGFIISWISQVVSSVAAFLLARYLGKKWLNSFLNNKLWKFYERYVNERGTMAVSFIRMAMAAPFNAISFVAGLTQMSIIDFIFATIFGTLPEVLLFPFVGEQLIQLHIRLWYVLILVILLGSIGIISSLIFLYRLQTKELKKKR